MTLLAPFALVGVLLLLLPIVVHLFKPRKMRQTPFSSLRWLKQTHQRLSRRIQWHQWLLFLLRAGCLLLLVLAVAKPLIGRGGDSRPTDRILILDTSRSMAYKLPDLPTPLERATELARHFIERARPGERTALVLAGAPPQLLAPLSADASQYLATLQAVKPGLADTTLSATLPLLRSLLPRPDQGEREVELVFLTDNLKQRWQQSDLQNFLKDLPVSVRVKVIEIGHGSASNAWISQARLFQFGPDEDRWLRVEASCVGEAPLNCSVRLAGIADDVQTITLKPGRIARVDFKIPASVSVHGQVAELRLEPADALPSDDVLFLNLDTPWSLRVLIVEPEAPGPNDRRVGLFVRAGVEALAAATKQALEVTSRTSTAVTTTDFRKADVIVLAGVPELADAALESLETRIRSGAGLALFLGPQMKSAFYNQKLHRPLQPAEGLLPFALKTGSDGSFTEGKPGLLTNVRWTHPLLASLHDPVLSDFTQSRFRIYGSLAGAPGKNDAVLARFDDAAPAIVEHPFGAGRVLLFNTTANDAWSDLPPRKSFVPLLDRVIAYLSEGGLKRSFTVGDAVRLPLVEAPPGSAATVRTPGGAKRSPRLIGLRGQTLLYLDRVAEAGVYRVEAGGDKNFAFVVNTGRGDSALSPMNAKALEAWWAPAKVEILSAETAIQLLEQQGSQWPLWPTLIVLAGLLLLAETIYVHRLCPRANPQAAEAVVPQRGMLRPLGEK